MNQSHHMEQAPKNNYRYGILLYMSRLWFLVIGFIMIGPLVVSAQSSLSLPVASTVVVTASESVNVGAVVRYDEETDVYSLSAGVADSGVYGVVADRPAVVFITSTSAVPVVTEGVSEVLVTMENGAIARGDVLTPSSVAGQAMRAEAGDQSVFAVALEDTIEPGLVLAYIGKEQAQAAQRSKTGDAAERGSLVSSTRAAVAGVLVLGALGFLLYSFRSIMTTGVLSIGRNPRARRSVLWIAIGSMLFAVVLTGLVVFVSIGILILPV